MVRLDCSTQDVIAALGMPVLLVDASGTILHANCAATQLIGAHPAFVQGRDQLRLRRADEAQLLTDSLHNVARLRRTPLHVTLASRGGRPVMIIRLSAVGERGDGPVMCEFEDLMAGVDDIAGLAGAMGLTVAQARVAALLMRGLTVPDIARELNVKDATLRTHIRLATARLGLEGQQALAVCTARVARFAGLLQPR
jgi:DNA-binding CsgD family transcriptional regulator